MNADKTQIITIDARGHHCPVPSLKLQKQMKQTQPGVAVVLLADDPMAQIDVPHLCNQNNYLLQSVEPSGKGWRFVISRP
ncbi:MAG: sulfurtransferase TusA family protein [Asticcacaulis sp.]